SLDFFDSFTGIYLFSIDAEYSVVSFVGLVGNKYYDQDFNFWVNTERGFIRRLKRIQRQATRGDYSPLSLDRFYARLLADSRTYLRAIYPYLKIRRKI
ncbi:MAG: hypothetical protein NTX66_02140, partial [Candidatus Falkowbacteria bacterium]|nr:hypothetical protein [Candidatus Falkowbacteria bacterium]